MWNSGLPLCLYSASAISVHIGSTTINSMYKNSNNPTHENGGNRIRLVKQGHIEQVSPMNHDPLNIMPVVNSKSRLAANCSFSQGKEGDNFPKEDQYQRPKEKGFWSNFKIDSVEMRSKLAKLGLAAVLAYGLFDGVTYTTFFVLAFLGYERSTGKNPASNLQALLGIVILMWTGNNITRPLRVAGAAALAPVIDNGLKKIQNFLKLPNLIYAFALVVAAVATSCLSVVGLLILSRWGK